MQKLLYLCAVKCVDICNFEANKPFLRSIITLQKPTWQWDITANNRMKKILSLSLVLLMGIACMQAAHPEKLIHGKFQVAPNEYAKFASANLCCHGNGHTFGFLSAQYEARKSNNEAITSTWTGTWDLFGWGTSGWNNGSGA